MKLAHGIKPICHLISWDSLEPRVLHWLCPEYKEGLSQNGLLWLISRLFGIRNAFLFLHSNGVKLWLQSQDGPKLLLWNHLLSSTIQTILRCHLWHNFFRKIILNFSPVLQKQISVILISLFFSSLFQFFLNYIFQLSCFWR